MSIIIKVEAKESALRTKIKKLTQAKSKLNTAVENLRQENVDLSSERDSSEMQLKHLNGVSGDRGKSLEAAKSEELKAEPQPSRHRPRQRERASQKPCASFSLSLSLSLAVYTVHPSIHLFYLSIQDGREVALVALVVNQNKKMDAEIAKYSSSLSAANELSSRPPTSASACTKTSSLIHEYDLRVWP